MQIDPPKKSSQKLSPKKFHQNNAVKKILQKNFSQKIPPKKNSVIKNPPKKSSKKILQKIPKKFQKKSKEIPKNSPKFPNYGCFANLWATLVKFFSAIKKIYTSLVFVCLSLLKCPNTNYNGTYLSFQIATIYTNSHTQRASKLAARGDHISEFIINCTTFDTESLFIQTLSFKRKYLPSQIFDKDFEFFLK
jgi:hypothetical protein